MGGTVASVARDLGVSRRQVRKTVAAARPFLERAGFDPQ
jgi:transposase-like protein